MARRSWSMTSGTTNINGKSMKKSSVEDTGNNIDVDDENTDGHVDTRTCSNVVRRGTIGGRNVQP